MNRIKHIALAFIACLIIGIVDANAYVASATFIKGIVRDSLSTQGLPYSSVTAQPSGVATVTDSRGIFEFNVPAGTVSVTASCQGYASKTVEVKPSALNLYDINLTTQAVELKALEVRKSKYSKRNNPAVDFARRLRNARHLSDPKQNDYYTYDKYERISLGINNFDTTMQNGILKRMPFLMEHVDSSEINGVPVLNLSLKENATTVMWNKASDKERVMVRGTQSYGVDEFLEKENVDVLLADLLREVDLYADNITLLRNTFISPLSPIAPDFYRFYLVDSTAQVEGYPGDHIALAFYPRNKASFGFSGHVYIPANDSTMFIRRVDMHTPKDINLNFIKDLRITQSYDRADNGFRLKRNDDMCMIFSVLPNLPELYVSRKINYKNHSFDHNAIADSLMMKLGKEYVQDEANSRDSIFWINERVVPELPGEKNIPLLVQRLRQNKVFYWGEKVLKILFSGYVGTSPKDSKFDIGPVNTFASYNAFEGLRLRFGGVTTASLSKHWFGRAYVAHGFRDHHWKYGAELEYSFNEKKYHSREFPVHSLRLTHNYDVDRLGSKYMFTNPDNFVLSVSRQDNRRYTYLRDSKLEYTLELDNNLSIAANIEHTRQEATPYVPFVKGNGQVFNYFNEMAVGMQLRFAPGEKFYQTKSERIPVDLATPVFILSHKTAARGILGSAYTINRTELSVSKLFRLPVVGNLYMILKGGHIWGSAPFTELFLPNANLSYTIQPESFALMNPMEFMNSTYAAIHATWYLRGALFNLIPGFKKLGLREVFTFNGLYGHLSKRSNPEYNSDLLIFPESAGITSLRHKPYMEVSAGIDNIFRVLRVDYVWRLTYLDVPYSIDRHGVRVALHFTF
ncbi:MAG: carboxypeptidase-like regulatory domain-containing protein [Muribaculaceae bacterium]|nr:carboxypeptidase-like regulatory domain-containing protein [Muribaculaceae bacterium]